MNIYIYIYKVTQIYCKKKHGETKSRFEDPLVVLLGLANFVVFAANTELLYDDEAPQRSDRPCGIGTVG